MKSLSYSEHFILPPDTRAALAKCEHISLVTDEKELLRLCCGGMKDGRRDISYEVSGRGEVKEAELVLCKNGLAVNFTEDYMRRRDPDCMSLADSLPGDKPRFAEKYGLDFEAVRKETLSWLSRQRLVLLPFMAGGPLHGYPSLLICPENAAFFALALGMMQGLVPGERMAEPFEPRSIIYLAPPFRHSHFAGKQGVVHQRGESCHEIFAYNLYPGPSAKKGVFSVLLDIGEGEGWLTNHASAVRCVSPEGKSTVFMHEGASGGGKSEMLEDARPDGEGNMPLARNTLSDGTISIPFGRQSRLISIADDMVLAWPDFSDGSGRLSIADGENGWFLRVDGDTAYGSIPRYEKASIHPASPLVFFNIEAAPHSTCLIWEHFMEESGERCSNPRVIIPRSALGCEPAVPAAVDVRSFGVRMPPSTAEKPDYGVMGMLQLVPAALAWLWRLVSPRGYKNPSIGDEDGGARLASEGVGSYWPFCTGSRVKQANLLLEQIYSTPRTLCVLIPNQHIGAYSVGFAGQWLSREYLALRQGRVDYTSLTPARCPLFGFGLSEMELYGHSVPDYLLRPWLQRELGISGYDAGSRILTEYFGKILPLYLTEGLDRRGWAVIDAFLSGASLEDYLRLSPPLPL